MVLLSVFVFFVEIIIPQGTNTLFIYFLLTDYFFTPTNLTQPAVSQHIHFLEQTYGVELFAHNGKRMELTRAGEILKRSALTMKHDEFHMQEKMRHAAGGVQNYAFGATLSVAEFMITEDLERFILNHPESHIRMEVANTKELLVKLDAGELDFAIVEGEFPKDEYEYLLYSQEEYVAAGNKKVAERFRGVSIKDLFTERIILREPGSGTREILENELKRRGLQVSDFANLTEIGNIGVIQKMLQAGLGVTFFYQATIKGKEELQVIQLNDFKLRHDIMFIYRKNSIFEKDYRQIYEEFRENGKMDREGKFQK